MSALDELLAANPAIHGASMRFMVLHDAADLLGELKPDGHQAAAAYLAKVAGQVLAEAGIPESFAQAMIDARPPLDIARLTANPGGKTDGS